MESLKELYLEMNTFEKEIELLSKVLIFLQTKDIKLSYSQDFLKDLQKFVDTYHTFKSQGINLTNLLIDTSNRDYSSKAAAIKGIKGIILDRFSEKDLNYLRINQMHLYDFLREHKKLLTAYVDSRYVNNKQIKEEVSDAKALTNYFILKKEYEYLKDVKETFAIFTKEYKSVILKEMKYKKPVYIGLKHLHQKKVYMEGPYFKGVKCPKCGKRVIHLLEGLTKDGSIYCCENLDCNFFINGNYFLKRGHDDLVNFFNIDRKVCEKRNSSHHKIYQTLIDSQNKKKFIEIESDGFLFRYKYSNEDYYIGMKLIEIEYELETLSLREFYAHKYKIFNFLKYFFEEKIHEL